jgi:hypothetical protein
MDLARRSISLRRISIMTALGVILDEAASHVFTANITILSDEQFRSIRSPSSQQFRARLNAALFGPDDLIEAERLNASEGLEVIEPVRGGIHGGYWFLRNVSNRGEAFPAGERQYGSIVEALQAAIEWWEVETWCRGVVIRKFYCNKANGAC